MTRKRGDPVREYESRRPQQEAFTRRMADLVRTLLQAHGIEYHVVEERTKEVQSFHEKISRSSKAYSDPLSEVTDLTGIRIIVYYDDDVSRAGQMIEAEFAVDPDHSVSERTVARPAEFGYKSAHHVVGLRAARASLREWSDHKGLLAEIQVRTVLQHAWAAMSHKLQYKHELDVPVTLRRRLYRLSALLELADDEFLALRDRNVAVEQQIKASLQEVELQVELSLPSVTEFVRTSPDLRKLVNLARAAGFGFEDFEVTGDDDGPSELVVLAHTLGLSIVEEIRHAARASLSWAKAYLRTQRGTAETDTWQATPLFILSLILIRQFADRISADDLVGLGWDAGIADRVVAVARTFAPNA